MENKKLYKVKLQATLYVEYDVIAETPQEAEEIAKANFEVSSINEYAECYNAYCNVDEGRDIASPVKGFMIIGHDGQPLRFKSGDNAIVVYGSIESAKEDFDPKFDRSIVPYDPNVNF